MWEDGAFEINDILFHYEAKVYDEGSHFGIHQGRISKLRITRVNSRFERCDDVVVQYDRCHWPMRPRTEIDQKALQYVLDLYQ